MPVIDFLGIPLSCISRKEITDTIMRLATSRRRSVITYLNAHCVNKAYSDQEYNAFLNTADMVYAGGQGVVWASRFLGFPLPGRVNILDFFDDLETRLRERGATLYLLGNRITTVQKTAEVLRARGLKVVGARHGYFDAAEEKEIIAEINQVKPDILMVGMGVPKQEKWIRLRMDELDTHLCWGVGAAFDWLSLGRKRAPGWMVRGGLEWLHRLYQQPVRLWRRYLIGNFIFVFRVIAWKINGSRR